ncbi:MAG: DNA-methyltransferase, partial [Planctomycetota bacterium]
MALQVNRIYQQDCLEGLTHVKPGSIDLAFADPPFNIGYDYDVYNDRQDYDKYRDWTGRWTGAVAETLKPTGAFWVAIGDEYAAEMKLILRNDCGLTCRSWVVWYYTFGVHCKYKFTRSHAHLFYFTKDPKKFTFNTDEIRVPSARQLVYADKRADPKGRVPDDTWI